MVGEVESDNYGEVGGFTLLRRWHIVFRARREDGNKTEERRKFICCYCLAFFFCSSISHEREARSRLLLWRRLRPRLRLLPHKRFPVQDLGDRETSSINLGGPGLDEGDGGLLGCETALFSRQVWCPSSDRWLAMGWKKVDEVRLRSGRRDGMGWDGMMR